MSLLGVNCSGKKITFAWKKISANPFKNLINEWQQSMVVETRKWDLVLVYFLHIAKLS